MRFGAGVWMAAVFGICSLAGAQTPPPPAKPTLYYIPHTHWEGAVFKTREEYLDMGLPNILKALRLLKAHPEFKFTLDQAAYVKPFLERYPEEAAAFRKFVAEGRLEMVGGMDVMPDVVKPGGELFVRQMQYGKRTFRDLLGVDVTAAWLVDTFGHHPQMPQLLRLAGFDSFWFCRGVPNDKMPSEFLWKGIDGTDIPAFWLPGFYGLFDGGRYEPALEVWLRQRGKALYTDEGKLGFDVSDIGEWLGFWHDLRKRGAIASAEVAALDMGELDTSLLTVGKTAMVLAHSNQLVGFQALVKSKLGMTMYPSGGTGAKYGQYLKPSMLLSVYARTRHPEAAVKLVDFYVANREAGMILGVERGVPASAAVRKAVEPTLDELGNAMASYVAFVSDKVSDLPAPPPQGAGEIQTVLRRVNEQIGFGRLSVADGAKQFIAEATAVLARG